ncbi:hypothetical protein Gohar_016525 [Gossypium harknessii]|uniref:RNase H type-1 domain-containing protein n=1 Tax=Gossypium harknessii TaxID=34285 RepID=A0A7J9G364_9ROSI|nr:hypothetical protein [Gossypium harknessii]
MDGLDILIDRGFENVLIQTDSLEVVTVIQESLIGGPNSALIGRILQLLYQIRHWNICYRPREENQEADRLAKLAHLESQDHKVVEVLNYGYVPRGWKFGKGRFASDTGIGYERKSWWFEGSSIAISSLSLGRENLFPGLIQDWSTPRLRSESGTLAFEPEIESLLEHFEKKLFDAINNHNPSVRKDLTPKICTHLKI